MGSHYATGLTTLLPIVAPGRPRHGMAARTNRAAGATDCSVAPCAIHPVCPKCGSDNVAVDAAARWSTENQEWEVSNMFDKGHGCDDCGAEDIELAWVEKKTQEVRL